MSPVMNREWRFARLASIQTTAFLLLGSWFYPPTRMLWDRLDASAFFFLNGSLESGHTWQIFWALANNRAFDLVLGTMMMGVFAHYHFSRDSHGARDRLAKGVVMLMYTVVAAIVFKHLVFHLHRTSPSLVLEPALRLSELVPWAHPKDASSTSFPGDHSAVLFMIMTFIWRYAGWRYGALAVVLALLGSLPRLVGGAHWLTDGLVGAGFIAMVSMSIALATPLCGYLESVANKKVDSLMAILDKKLPWLAGWLVPSK
ncbi:MAG: phosphatase PAP2 family protein [Gammaproteobacteria bacterium]|nr:phosphatase PAP2 family protein [Gammaproteobacteria bacterium]